MDFLFKLREGLVINVKSPSCDELPDRGDDLLLGWMISGVLLSLFLDVLRFVIVKQVLESPLSLHLGERGMAQHDRAPDEPVYF